MTGAGMGAAPWRAAGPGARTTFLAFGIAGAAALASSASAQTIADRVRIAPDGEVRLTFASRPGVCGDGRNIVSFGRSHDDVRPRESDDSWYRNRCVPGPVRVVLTVRHHEVTSVRTHVGGPASSARRPTAAGQPRGHTANSVTDLGPVPAADAAQYFLSLARRLDGSAAGHALLPAVLADSVDVAPDLLGMTRDRTVRVAVRKKALFWAGQGDAPVAQLGAMYDELSNQELKKEAIFVLSQRHERSATDKLLQIVRRDTDFGMRKQALFWLAQADDPRVDRLILGLLAR